MRARFFFILLLLVLSPSAHARSGVPRDDVHVVILVLDGCRPDILYGMIDRSELPAVKRHLVDRGTRFTDAITVFPSATVNAYQSMVTGLFPGHAGIPYLEWFDRDTQEIVNFFSFKGAQLFNERFQNVYGGQGSIFDDLAPAPTAAVYTPFFRHASIRAPKVPLALLWAGYGSNRPEMMDVYSYRHLLRLFRLPTDQIPRVTFAALLGTDHIAHTFGVQHARVARNLHQFDAFIGEFIGVLRERKLLRKTYVIVTADHGMHDITGVFDLPALLGKAGLREIRESRKEHANVFIGARGVSVATVTVKHPAGWQIPIDYATLRAYPVTASRTVDVIERIAIAPETDLLLVRDTPPGRVRVFRGREEGLLMHHRVNGRSTYSYRTRIGDPLGLSAYPHVRALVHGQRLSARAWGERLRATDTPGVVPQLAHIFDDGRAGDLVVIAKLPWGFYHLKAATHGTHHAVDMRVPLLIRGPGIPVGQRGYAQVSDIYPTVQRWLGLPAQQHLIDGSPLFE